MKSAGMKWAPTQEQVFEALREKLLCEICFMLRAEAFQLNVGTRNYFWASFRDKTAARNSHPPPPMVAN